jgi:hypothetical protein
MAAYEPYDDSGLPVAVSDVDQTLTLQGGGDAAIHRASKRVKVFSSVDGKSETRVNFSGSNTMWFLVIPYQNKSQSDAGILMQYWLDYGESNTYSFKYTHADGHTYVIRFANDLEERWLRCGNVYSHSYIFRVLGKI